VLGGAFNPPHVGHLVLAHEAAFQLGLERVVLMPTGNAPHKEIEQDPGAGVRLEMTTLAAPGDQIYFLMGADVAANLASWKRPERVLELARLGIAARPGTAAERAEAALERIGAGDRAEWIRMPELGVSSSSVRRRVAQARPIRYLVTDPVLELIEANDLYREAVRA
jgi:nicotinate-nucleotide adenylyltransferase